MRLALCALLVTLTAPLAAQDAKSAEAAANAAAAAKLSGRWHLKPEASTRPAAPPEPDTRSGRGRENEVAPESVRQMRAMTRETGDAPDPVTIVATVTMLTVTAPDGVPRRFTLNARKEKVDLIFADANVVSAWNAGALSQEITTGHYKLERTYQVSIDGKQLVVTTRLSGGPPDSALARTVLLPTRLVYEKVSY